MKLLRVWTENINLLVEICKSENLKISISKGFTDSDGDKIHSVDIIGKMSAQSWGHYQKHRIRK